MSTCRKILWKNSTIVLDLIRWLVSSTTSASSWSSPRRLRGHCGFILRAPVAECLSIFVQRGIFLVRIWRKTYIVCILIWYIIHNYTYMGQILQDGENPWFTSNIWNKTIKDGDISPWPLDHNCPYGHMERFDQMEWREHNNGLDQSYGEDRQACVSCAFAPSARRPCVWNRLDGILCTISYLSISSLKLQVPGCTWLYLAVLGCIWL